MITTKGRAARGTGVELFTKYFARVGEGVNAGEVGESCLLVWLRVRGACSGGGNRGNNHCTDARRCCGGLCCIYCFRWGHLAHWSCLPVCAGWHLIDNATSKAKRLGARSKPPAASCRS